MRKQDIKVGEEYAVSRANDFENCPWSVNRVRITGPAKENVRRHSWEARSTQFPCVTLDVNGEAIGTMSATSREIRQPWAEYAAEQAARNEAKAKAADASHRAAVEAWKQFKQADDLLGLVGVERRSAYLPDRDVRAAAEVGFKTEDRVVYTALDVVHGRVVVTPAKFLLAIRAEREANHG